MFAWFVFQGDMAMTLDKKMAVRLARVCQWAYDFDEAREAELLEFRGKAPIRETQIKDRQRVPTSFAGIVEFPDVIIVAFQGTITEFGHDGVFRLDSLVDWIQNFRIRQLKTNGTDLPGLVHEGFFSQLDLVYDQVKSDLSVARNKPIVVTGHSQGGAIAVLATKRLKNDGFPVRESYTFAAPRAGDAVFARSIKTPFHRIEFGNDIVPHVPPLLVQSSILGSGLSALSKIFDLPPVLQALNKLTRQLKKNSYQSVGRLIYRAEGGALLLNLTVAAEKRVFNVRRKKLAFAGKDLVRHHGLGHYVRMFS